MAKVGRHSSRPAKRKVCGVCWLGGRVHTRPRRPSVPAANHNATRHRQQEPSPPLSDDGDDFGDDTLPGSPDDSEQGFDSDVDAAPAANGSRRDIAALAAAAQAQAAAYSKRAAAAVAAAAGGDDDAAGMIGGFGGSDEDDEDEEDDGSEDEAAAGGKGGQRQHIYNAGVCC
jgi:hypothetical protein